MSMKLPPDPSSSNNYELWRKDIELWQQLTDTPAAKQGVALQYACRNNPKLHEAVHNIDPEVVKGTGDNQGIDAVLHVLDQLHNVDKKETAVKCYQDFLSLKRKRSQKVSEFLLEFDRLSAKTIKNGNQLSEDLLAFRLLQAVNLSETDERIVRSTAATFTVAGIKEVLNKGYGDTAYNTTEIKTEPIYHTTGAYGCDCKKDRSECCEESHQHEVEVEESYYASNNWRNKKSYKPNNGKSYKSANITNQYQFAIRQPTRRGKNPLDKQGNITQCHICYSINHWADDCPDGSEEEKASEALYSVTFFEDDVENPDNIRSLVYETFGCAVLDCGAAKSVCGETWLEVYIDSLQENDKSKVEYSTTTSVFKFGSNKKIKALKSVKIPIELGRKKTTLQTDVVSEDIPLLFSKLSMKKAKMQLDTEKDVCTMLGEKIKLINTSTGHYAIPISPSKNALENNVKINLLSRSPNISIPEMAVKLHRQFAHPSAKRLISLVENSKYHSKELNDEIREVSESCDICRRYKKCSPRPVVSLSMSNHFNEAVAMDLSFIKGEPVLHLIDQLTRYSMSAVLCDNRAQSVIRATCKNWITTFGAPEVFLIVNKEFGNEELTELGEAFNIKVMTTAAESPHVNGICVRYSKVLREMVTKILEEVSCSLDVAVTWANSARNSLQTVHGFSPAQLVFGFTPMLPSVQNDRPPALSMESAYSEIVQQNLEVMRKARIAYVQAESSERIRRELNQNVTGSGDMKYVNGDTVYFKQKDDNRWSGPGTVIGQDGQFVLVRNQHRWIRVHPCRLQLIPKTETYQSGVN